MKRHDTRIRETGRSLAGIIRVLVFSGAVLGLTNSAHATTRNDGNSAVVTIKSLALEVDTDGDGLSDTVEAKLGTDPSKLDSDSDGIDDAWEIANGLDPNDPTDADKDYDGDGLTNIEEYWAGTSPYSVDTDGDGFWDSVEVACGTDPLDAGSVPKSSLVGDVNCDGKVDAVDVQMVINGALSMATSAPTDVNKVGGVNALDIQLTINAAMGL